MPRHFIISVYLKLALILFFGCLYVNASANENGLQFVTLSASKQLDSGHTLIGVIGDIHEEFAGEIAYLGLAKKMDSGLVWKAGYFGYFPEQDDGHYIEDHRLRGSLSYTFKLNSWRLMHRSRVEYRMGQLSSGFRYRPTLNLSRPITIGETTLIPYAEVEPFYDFKQHQLTLTIFTAGIKWPVTPNISLNIGHMNIFLNEENTHAKGPLVGLHIKL